MISGTGATGQMLLRTYDTEGTLGDPGLAHVVPEPAAAALFILAAGVFLRRRRQFPG